MSDRGYGYIEIGGVILEKDVAELCEKIGAAGADLQYDDELHKEQAELFENGTFSPKSLAHLVTAAEYCGGYIVISDSQAVGGYFDDLESFCADRGIDFNRHSDQLYEYSAEAVYFRRELGNISPAFTNNAGDFLVGEDRVLEAIDLLEKNEPVKALKHLKELITEVPDLYPATFKMENGETVTPKIAKPIVEK